jgi:hypothetical protein
VLCYPAAAVLLMADKDYLLVVIQDPTVSNKK